MRTIITTLHIWVVLDYSQYHCRVNGFMSEDEAYRYGKQSIGDGKFEVKELQIEERREIHE